jgi:tagaturonate epimerase
MQLLSSRLDLMQCSLVSNGPTEFGLTMTNGGRKLAVLSCGTSPILDQFEGEFSELDQQSLKLCPLNHHNAASLRSNLEWLKPGLVGLRTSVGMGDRMGIATPGHVRAIKRVGGEIVPIFAQQSIREMRRTGRSPQQVFDDATWGIFEEGWKLGAGADADHLKTFSDIDDCFTAGFTFFTFDPGEFVDQTTLQGPKSIIDEKLKTLPPDLQPEATGLIGKSFDIEGHEILMSRSTLSRAIVKYGRAVEHIGKMYDHLCSVAGYLPFEVEISMDETELPTSPAEHVYIASEIKRRGIRWISFAPRFIGRFEKGVDYIGDLSSFKADVAAHAAIARQLGPYKLSLHSGSDKFSIYPIFMEATQGLSHMKTAGTSYLEALRTVAERSPEMMREIYQYALERFDYDRQSYHISAELNRAPNPEEVTDWMDLFSKLDTREILHVTFGSVLTEKTPNGVLRFYNRMMSLLNEYRETYFNNLEQHFVRHLQPFSK